MKSKNKILYYILFIFIFFIIYLFFIPTCSSCSYPTLITKLSNGFSKINGYIKVLSTPAAATAIGTGIFIKKFSFGDEDRIRTGKKLIKTALFSYAFLLCTELILSTICLLLA